jgi:hypothetical protein
MNVESRDQFRWHVGIVFSRKHGGGSEKSPALTTSIPGRLGRFAKINHKTYFVEETPLYPVHFRSFVVTV